MADEVGSLPRVRDVNKHGAYSYGVYHDRFGGIEDAHKAAGLISI